MPGQLLKGLLMLCLLCENYWASEANGKILEFKDLDNVEMKGGGLRSFMKEWELTLVGMSKTPEVDVLKTLSRIQLHKQTLHAEGAHDALRMASNGTRRGELRFPVDYRSALPRSKHTKQGARRTFARKWLSSARIWRRSDPIEGGLLPVD